MSLFLRSFLGCVLGVMSFSFAGAEPVKIDHQPLDLNRAELVVVGTRGAVSYAPEELELLGFRRLTTVTPWRDAPAAFDGVLLSDLLAANGLSDVSAINVVAENDYTITLPSEVWKRWPILVATRVNGRPHTRRQRGPIQFILPMSDHAEAGATEQEAYWVWMAARIEPAS